MVKRIYKVNYYIKDLTTDKIIETNLEKFKKNTDHAFVFHKGPKYLFEEMGGLFPKVEEAIKNMKEKETKTLKLKPEEAYGKRNPELLRIIPYKVFKENKLTPVVGLTIDIGNGMYGTIRSISGGRILVDFNSPYADHDIEVFIEYLGDAEGKEKAEIITKTFFKGFKHKDIDIKDKTIKITLDKSTEKDKEQLEKIYDNLFKQFFDFDKIELNFK